VIVVLCRSLGWTFRDDKDIAGGALRLLLHVLMIAPLDFGRKKATANVVHRG